MKNAHGVEPTRYMKKEDSEAAIDCCSDAGPIFGCFNIGIRENCNKEDSCLMNHFFNFEYEYHPEYKSSLYVNTNGPNKMNYFSVLDYEVYTH